jgi:predicted NAD-dependent protein-ADP-ribosyltransferase YbiA (DUF1768 family)
MGCGMSAEEKEGKARNEEIENQLKRDKMMQRNEIKMLLLGTHDTLLRNNLRIDTVLAEQWEVLGANDATQVLVNPESRRFSSK